MRRSGAKVARFDHDGWMRDRQRMFAHAMTVTADGEHAVELRDRVFVSFTQTFEQGSYHDEGRKGLVLARRPTGLAIVHEEMLDSMISAPARPRIVGFAFGLGGASAPNTMELALVHEGQLLLARTDDDVGAGPLAGEHEGSMGPSEHVAVTRAIANAPPALAAAVGLEVRLLDEHLAPACTGTIAAIDSARAMGTDEREDDVWKHEVHVVIARLDAPGACRASARFARPAALPALPAPQVSNGRFTSPDGTTSFDVLTDVETDCNQTEVRKTTVSRRPRGLDGEVAAVLEAVAALDVDGDGAPDLVTTTGVFRGSLHGAYDDWWPRMDWDLPASVGCDGYDPNQ